MKWLWVLVIAGRNTSSDVFNTVGNEAARRGARFWPARHAPIGRRAGQEPLHRLGNRHGAVAFFALLKLLAIAPLSFAIPATTAGYLSETVLAKYLLREQVTWKRWAGASLVASGVALLA